MTNFCRAFPLRSALAPPFCCAVFHFFSLCSAFLLRFLPLSALIPLIFCCLPFHCLPAAGQMEQDDDGFECWTVAQLLFYIGIHSSICIFSAVFYFGNCWNGPRTTTYSSPVACFNFIFLHFLCVFCWLKSRGRQWGFRWHRSKIAAHNFFTGPRCWISIELSAFCSEKSVIKCWLVKKSRIQ